MESPIESREIERGVTITYLPVLAFSFIDMDADRKLTAGDTLVGIPQVPDGERWTFSYVIDLPREWGLLAPESLFLHAGYNWWSAPATGCAHHFLNNVTFHEWTVSIPLVSRN